MRKEDEEERSIGCLNNKVFQERTEVPEGKSIDYYHIVTRLFHMEQEESPSDPNMTGQVNAL